MHVPYNLDNRYWCPRFSVSSRPAGCTPTWLDGACSPGFVDAKRSKTSLRSMHSSYRHRSFPMGQVQEVLRTSSYSGGSSSDQAGRLAIRRSNIRKKSVSIRKPPVLKRRWPTQRAVAQRAIAIPGHHRVCWYPEYLNGVQASPKHRKCEIFWLGRIAFGRLVHRQLRVEL